MTWGEFKKKVEEQGVDDSMEIDMIDYDGNYIAYVDINGKFFVVYDIRSM